MGQVKRRGKRGPHPGATLTKQRKEQVIDLLRRSRGIITPACRMAGVARSTFYRWIESDPDFARAHAEALEERIDLHELKLEEHIQNGSERSLLFFLETKAKHRGYTKQFDLGGVQGKPIQIEIRALPPDTRGDVLE